MRQLAAPPRFRLIRPLLGAAAALALVFGGAAAFSYQADPPYDPGQRQWTICMPVVVQPLPPATGQTKPCAGAGARPR
ncbi:hypothetical protein [Nocardia brasiliensis]|uniref:hypothetical protein n=1 Tax=Nocardia brasiliensis TaxID=37326 RepID=UPI0009DD441D|nr:hypothetical protein [Nocardia brasiliensis]ASF07296.1 hypothetical protein CEQ30_07935 [Nocardia brasiliensis]